VGDFDYDLSDPTGAAPRPKRKAVSAPTAAADDATFQRYLADPTLLPDEKWPLSPEQKKAIRDRWPILNEPLQAAQAPGEKARVAQLNQRLDRLLSLGEQVYSDKADKKAVHAVAEHFEWVKEKERRGTGERGAGSALAEHFGIGSGDDPIEKLKGPSRSKALAMVQLAGVLRDVHGGTGEGGTAPSPYEIMTTHLPSPKDSPEDAAGKRRQFTAQIQELAKGFVSNDWRQSVKHTLRARALSGAGQVVPPKPSMSPPTGNPTAPTSNPTQGGGAGLTGQVSNNSPSEMGVWEALKRSALQGATTLSVPVMASIAHAVTSTGDVPLGEGMTQYVPEAKAPEVTEPQMLEATKGAMRAAPMGDANAAEFEAKREEAGDVLGKPGQFLAEVGGGMADPTNYMLGPLSRAVGMAPKLSPAARALLGHAVTGGAAGGLAAHGEGHDTVRGALIGMGLGAVLGKVADKVLDSPATSDVVEAIAKRFGAETKAGTAGVAAKKAAMQATALGSDEARRIAAGSKIAAEKLGPQLVDRRNAILDEYGVKASSPLAKKVGEIEDAIDAGDTKLIESLRKELTRIEPTKQLRKSLNELFNLRELATERATSGGHGAVSQYGANIHPFATLANPEAGAGAQVAAGIHEGMVRGPQSLPILGMAAARTGLKKASTPMKVALAKLYLAQQSGDMMARQMAAEEAIRSGAPFSLLGQITSRINWDDEE